jgi:uncharacterized protein (TIGR03000 family)
MFVSPRCLPRIGIVILLAVGLSLVIDSSARAAPDEGTGSSRASESARIQVHVPSNAEVWFNNDKTRLTGAIRAFDTPPLAVGRDYGYLVRVRWWNGDRYVEQQRQLVFQAGDTLNIDFLKAAPPPIRAASRAVPDPAGLPGPDDTRSFLASE